MKGWHFLAALPLAILLAAALWLYRPLDAVPSAAALTDMAAGYEAEIVRDDYGVPHVYGERDADTAFGLAFAHAEDDYETIQEVVAATRGRLARYRGRDAAPTDYIVHLMGVWPTIGARYESDVPAEVKALAEGYAAGLNLYAAGHRDETWAGLAPFTAEDAVAGFMFKTPFFYGLDETLLTLFEGEEGMAIALDPAAEGESFVPTDDPGPERGSNAFAVAPSRSGDGSTRLLINSHQPMTGPVAWYEAHLVSDEGLDITGGLFPGTPVILHGFNDDVGWANTVNKPDLVDVYAIETHPDDPDRYRFDGDWHRFETDSVTIDVRLLGPFVYRARREVRRTVHGPVIEGPSGLWAVRYAGRGEIRQLEQYHALNHADGVQSFMDALAIGALPSINYIYADREGNIAFVHNGQYPDRTEGWDWQAALPGDRADLVWSGYRPFSDVPKLVNPESGFVWNANNAPYLATDGNDNLTADTFPASMGLQPNDTNRSLRIAALTDGETPITEEALLAIKFDDAYADDSLGAQIVAEILAADWSDDPELDAAARHLGAWDLRTDRDNRHAALGVLTVQPALIAEIMNTAAPTAQAAFRQAVTVLNRAHGRLDVPFGEVNRLVRGNLSIPVDGGPDTLRAIYGELDDADGTLAAVAGDTWIALVTWDPSGALDARVVHQFGNAMGRGESAHHTDQMALFADQRWRPALRSRPAIDAVATSRTHLKDGRVIRR